MNDDLSNTIRAMAEQRMGALSKPSRQGRRRFANGGAIDEYGNDLTRSNAMGAVANDLRDARIARESASAASASPASSTPTSAQILNADMNDLGKINPVPGEGAGAQHNWFVKSATDLALEQGRDPHAPAPTYRANGQMMKPSIADLSPVAARRAPVPNMMRSIDDLFPARRGLSSFADGGVIGLLQNRKNVIDAAVDGATNPNAPQPASTPAPVPTKPSMGSEADDYAAQAAKIEAEQQAAAKARMATPPKKKGLFGFTSGGKIQGPGTPTSDSVPARVKETGEPIQVSTGERIVSAAQEKVLQKIAQGIGFKSLDDLLEAGTGKKVGPTIRHGMAHAATGLTPEEERPYVAPISQDPYVLAGKTSAATVPVAPPTQARPLSAEAAPQQPTTLPSVPVRSPVSTTPPDDTAARPGLVQSIADGLSRRGPQAMINDAQKAMNLPSGGIGAIAQGNQGLRSIATDPAVREKLNTAHASIGDGVTFGTTTGADGRPQTIISGGKPSKAEYIGTDGQPTDDWTRTNRYQQAVAVNTRMKNLAEQMQRDRLERDAYDPSITNDAVRTNARQALATIDRRAAYQGEMQGRQLDNQIKQTRLASDTRLGTLQAAYLAEDDSDRKDAVANQIRDITGKSPSGPNHLTLTQLRGNHEIDAARKTVAGLSQADIRKRTAKTTDTGRENPDFDPMLERAVKQASRRKVGSDDYFDEQRSPQPEALQYPGNDGDQVTRFRSDQSMKGHRLGRQTEKGYEVFDSTGKHIGYYR